MQTTNKTKAPTVSVYFLDGMPISRSLRNTVELCRRHLTRGFSHNCDLYVYSNYAESGSPMVKMSLWNHGQSVKLKKRSGEETDSGISPNTLLEWLEKGVLPVAEKNE